jgi:hypothetical protein
MTDESSRPTSEDMPAPPASTRWTEEPLQEDDALARPFVPGRSAAETPSRPAPVPGGDTPVQEATRPEETTAEPAPDAFPFEQFDLEGEGGEEAPGAAAEIAETTAPPMGWTPADLNVEDVAVEEEPAVEEPAADAWAAQEPAAEAWAAEQPAAEQPAAEASVGDEPAREAAEVLERLAGLLRSDGLEAVRGEMQSSDRLTSLLAGLVAGYVTGRG